MDTHEGSMQEHDGSMKGNMKVISVCFQTTGGGELKIGLESSIGPVLMICCATVQASRVGGKIWVGATDIF